jgi:hypothetical protein
MNEYVGASPKSGMYRKVQEGARDELPQARRHHEGMAEKRLERSFVVGNKYDISFFNTLWSDDISPACVQSN